jgi:hypothetical protein
MACNRCQWPYPDELLVPIFIGGEGYSQPVCGLCALEMINEALGIHRTEFSGEMAEEKRQEAIRWRRTHPHAQPVGGKT